MSPPAVSQTPPSASRYGDTSPAGAAGETGANPDTSSLAGGGPAADANALRDKARAAGFSAFVEQVNTDKGPLNRVRIGPVATRDEAEKLKASVAAKLGVSGMVRTAPR